ncbi:MAG: phage holin family protein [Myxococcota bacterium]
MTILPGMELLIVTYLLKALLILVLAKILPGVRVNGFGSALGVAVVYALLSTGLMWFLKILSLPFILLTFGLFTFVLYGFLLWMTDKLIEGFEIRGLGSLTLATLAMTFGNLMVEAMARSILT